jgi:ribosomal protein L24
MLNLPLEEGPVVISVPLLILAYIVLRQPIKQVTILGVSFFADKFQSLAVKIGIGIASGSIFFFTPVGVVSLTSTLLTAAIFFNIAQGISSFECNNFVSKVTMERVSQEKTIGFLETLSEKTPKVFIKGSKNIELYIPSHNDNGSCSFEYKEVEIKKSNIRLVRVKTETQTQIHRTCERKYVSLKKRTKTLADLKKEDSTENQEKAEPYIKRYENCRRDIRNKRVE